MGYFVAEASMKITVKRDSGQESARTNCALSATPYWKKERSHGLSQIGAGDGRGGTKEQL